MLSGFPLVGMGHFEGSSECILSLSLSFSSSLSKIPDLGHTCSGRLWEPFSRVIYLSCGLILTNIFYKGDLDLCEHCEFNFSGR